jgi:hypothetical protein
MSKISLMLKGLDSLFNSMSVSVCVKYAEEGIMSHKQVTPLPKV